jgi:F-type H+-transporting ATPase subunit delta
MNPPRRVETVMDPVGESVARVYAEALLAQVPSDVEAEEVGAELDGLVELMDRLAGFEELLIAALPSAEDRCEMVGRLFHGRVSEPLEAALNVMAQGGRLGMVRLLRRTYRSALNHRQGKREVTVVTAGPLEEAQRARVRQVLAETLGAEPIVTYELDRDLLGGMVVRVGDRVYDASIRAELRAMQEKLRREIELDAPAPAGGRPDQTGEPS